MAVMVALKVKDPEGLVSDAAYISSIPPGSPTRFTSAVSLVDLIEICTCTGVPFNGTTTWDGISNTEIGGPIGPAPVTLPPHPFNTQIMAASTMTGKRFGRGVMVNSCGMAVIRAQ